MPETSSKGPAAVAPKRARTSLSLRVSLTAREEERAVSGMGRKPRAGQTQYPGYSMHDKQGVPGKHCLLRSLRPGTHGRATALPPRPLRGLQVRARKVATSRTGQWASSRVSLPHPGHRSSWELLLPLCQPQPRARSGPGRADPAVWGQWGRQPRPGCRQLGGGQLLLQLPQVGKLSGVSLGAQTGGHVLLPASSSPTRECHSSPSPPPRGQG